jgi:hypothetical protein
MNRRSLTMLLWTLNAYGARALAADSPAQGSAVLQSLRNEHPRLLASRADFAAIKARIGADATLSRWHADVRNDAEGIFSQPLPTYDKPDGIRLLATSRRVLERIYTLGMMFRLSGDRRYAERAWAELDAAARFPDWNPSHFLDVAEMSHGFAIGYDWLHDVWTPAQREALIGAIVGKGLEPGLAAYAGSKEGWWAKNSNNWNLVCNGGLGMAALAVGKERPELAADVLGKALNSLRDADAINSFAPDGGWVEGPGYWSYASRYLFTLLAGLRSALGTDFGLSNTPGLAEAGRFPIYVTGPANKTFNFADGSDGRLDAPVLLWMAEAYGHPEYAAYQQQNKKAAAEDLLWYRSGASTAASSAPLDAYFRKAEVVSLRQAWDDANASFVAFKAGNNAVPHSHLDVGSFVLQALGQQWALDLGNDNYNLPGHGDVKAQRWTYYRNRAEGHNTLVINPGAMPDQKIDASTKVIKLVSKAEQGFAIADLSPAYPGHKAQRGIALLGNRREVIVQDEIESGKSSELWWFMHTKAQIDVDASGQGAMLTLGGKRLWARIVGTAGARFSVMDANPLPSSPNPAGQNANTGYRKLAIHLQNTQQARITVWFVPLESGQNPPSALPVVRALADW